MLNKYFIQCFLILIFLVGYSCSSIRNISKGVYTQVKGKDRFLFLKEDGKYRFMHYRLNKDKSYSSKGYLQQVSDKVFITYEETIQSILVDSALNEIVVNKEFRKEIKKNLNQDTLFFSNDYKNFIYGKHKFEITE